MVFICKRVGEDFAPAIEQPIDAAPGDRIPLASIPARPETIHMGSTD